MDSFTLNKVEFDSLRRIVSEFCATIPGKRLAAHLAPSRNPEVIKRWQEQTDQMVSAVRDHGLPPFAGVTDIAGQLERARPGGGAAGEDFNLIASALEGSGNVRKYLLALPETLEALRELAAQIVEFPQEVQAIRDTLDETGAVRDSASEKLAELRKEIVRITQEIHDVIYGFLRAPEVARLLQNVNVTLHGDRYVLPVKAEHRGKLEGVVHRASNTGATFFVEPAQCVEMNNRLMDLREDEKREIERLLSVLAIKLAPRAEEIAATVRAAAQIDILSAKAQYAYQNDMIRPELSERGQMQVFQARHPLLIEQARRQEKAGYPPERRHAAVPIDVRLGSDFDLLVITGSNTGGKTVALKTAAMLCIMAQCGMQVPAQRGAVLPVFHDIFIDVGDEQSLQQSLSTFGAHIKRIRYILSKVDRNCLVLLDELGAGTDPEEGGAIGQAILDELREIGCLGMITTHLSVLKAYAYTHDRVDNASVEFDVATLRPTYKLKIGQPGESHAISVAGSLGLPKKLIQAARKHLAAQGQQFRKAIKATGLARQVAEEAKVEAHNAQLAARDVQESYESKLADLHRLQDEFQTWLAALPELRPGDEVYVPSLKKNCRLVRLELHRQIALVDAGNMEIETPLRELMPDLGQDEIRGQIAELRKKIIDQAASAEQAMARAQHVQDEYHRSLAQQKERARQFDTWLGSISRLKVGDEVAIALPPGRGTLVKVDLAGLRATVATQEGEKEFSIQELFPQTGPFANLPQHPPAGRREAGAGQDGHPRRPQGQVRGGAYGKQGGRPGAGGRTGAAGQDRRQAAHGEPQRKHEPEKIEPDRPIHRVDPASDEAKKHHEALLAAQPGQQVFVIPFNKKATLIRVNADKDQAVVQSGIFEMTIPLADLEPIAQQQTKA
ncbi:MAG: hypothetical protein HZA50_05360 [Planctomycetes bacterium]|nr:hypothetical protein [Planctomycetota bacterium]